MYPKAELDRHQDEHPVRRRAAPRRRTCPRTASTTTARSPSSTTPSAGCSRASKSAAPADEPVVIFTSDNGPEYPVNEIESRGLWKDPLRDRSFGTPGPLRGMKRYTYEGGHRVPLLLRWPGRVREGIVSDELVNGTDLLPTLCELAGAPVPTGPHHRRRQLRAPARGPPAARVRSRPAGPLPPGTRSCRTWRCGRAAT